jgi:DNA-binding response OmpR family regulator
MPLFEIYQSTLRFSLMLDIKTLYPNSQGSSYEALNKNMDRVLVLEDDFDIATLITVNLSELGLSIEHHCDGQKGLNAALENDYALVLLDVMLPSLGGLDICRNLRDKKPEQAIIMLTAKNSETDRVLELFI